MSINFNRAIIAGKLGDSAINIIDRSRGTNWAGRKAMEIDPEILKHFSGIDPDKVLFITGTNGKSTINSLINHILRHRGYKVVSNIEGANLVTGVASALVKASSLSGKVKADYYIFETDERYLYQIREQLPCSNLLITNLQKDQVQRNGDPDFVYRKIARVIDRHKMRLFLNGDEPRSCSLAARAENTVFYGVSRHAESFVKDDTFVTMPCPYCKSRIVYDHYNNDGMGSFRCSRCGYTNFNSSGEGNYIAQNIDFESKSFTVNDTEFTMPYEQPYMLYDYAAAVAAVKELAGITEEQSAEALKSFHLIDGRIESINYRGKNVRYIRFKQENPETLQNFISVLEADPEEKVVVMGMGTINDFDPYYINSFYAFDCDYTGLKNANVKKYIFVTDTIAYDAANSFIYGGVDPDKIEVLPTSDEQEIFRAIETSGCKNVYLTIALHKFELMKEYARKEH